MYKVLFVFVAMTIALSTSVYAATELAKVNGTVITLEEFNRQYKDNLKYFRYKTPTKKNVLDDLIKRDLGVQEAKRLGFDKDPEVIERINTVLYHSLLDKQLAGKFDTIEITDDEVAKYYKSNPEIRTSHIFVQLRYDANASQQKVALDKIKKIKQVLDENIKSGKMTFAEVARQYSEGVAATSGGDIDFQTKDKLDPAYYQVAVNLKKVGVVSDVVRSQFGYHIIKLTGIKDFRDADKGAYKRLLFDEKRSKLYEVYMDELKKKAKIVVHDDLLKE